VALGDRIDGQDSQVPSPKALATLRFEVFSDAIAIRGVLCRRCGHHGGRRGLATMLTLV
jgi:hypothetical protein